MFAGVLDFLNNGGSTIIGVVIVVSVVYFLAHVGFQMNRCQAKDTVTGDQCRLALRHKPRRKHRTWGGREFWT